MGKKHAARDIRPDATKVNFLNTHWAKITIILLILLPLIYFLPFLNPGRMIAGSDYLIGGYPFEKWTKEQHELPLWYSHVFSGIPVLGAPVGGPLAPLNHLRDIMPTQVALALVFIIIFVLAGLGMYLYLREIGLSMYAATIGAVIYQFIGSLATTPEAGHHGRAASVATLPLILYFVHRGMSTKRLSFFVLTALVTALAFYEGHFQMTYYGLLFVLAYVIYYLISHRRDFTRGDLLNILFYGLSAVVMICLLMAAVWLPVLGGLSTAARGVERGYTYATSWSLPPRELIDLITPTYSGILENYWGSNPFKIHLEYFGLLPIVFSIFAVIFYWRRPYVKFYLITIFIVAIVVLGSATPFYRIFYALIPAFKLFRAPSLAFYLISFGFIVLGMIGLDRLVIQGEKVKDQGKIFYAVSGICLAVLLITGIICASSPDSVIQSMQESLRYQISPTKLNILRSNFPSFVGGIWRSLLFTAAILGLILFSFKKHLRLWTIAGIAIVIGLVDQLPFVSKFLPSTAGPAVYYAADDVIKFLKRDTSIFRVFPTPWYEHAADSYLLYHNIQSAGGYVPNPIQRYQEFIGAGTSVMFNPVNLIQYPRLVDLLNAKYLIAPNLPDDVSRYDPATQQMIQELKKYFSRYSLALMGRRYSVYQNDSVLPRAFFVPDYRILDETVILDTMQSQDFDPRRFVILEEDPGIDHSGQDLIKADVSIVEYTPNRVVVSVESPKPGFLILLDNWHPDWQAFIDGSKTKLFRADYTFRAVYLNAGKHEVRFAYISPYFDIGRIVSILTLILAIGFCLIAVRVKA